MINLIEKYGAEGVLIRLLAEMEQKTNLLPTDTVTTSGSELYGEIVDLLDKAMALAADWDAEVRRNGFAVGRLPQGAQLP